MLHGDAYVAAVLRPWVERVVEMVQPAPGDVVADLGCGDGALTCALARRGARVLAVDEDVEALRATVEAAAGWGVSHLVVPLRGGTGALPLRDASVDAVVSMIGVMASALPAALQQTVHICRNDGRIRLLMWDESAVHERVLREAAAEQLGRVPNDLAGCVVSADILVRSTAEIAPRLVVERLRGVARFHSTAHYWETMVTTRPVAHVMADLPDAIRARIRDGCARRLESFAGHDGTLCVPAETMIVTG